MESVEQWKPVVGWEGWYEVSDMGRVRRVAPGRGVSQVGRVMTTALNPKTRYASVHLQRPGANARVMVHSVVMQAHVGPRPAGCEVNHIDGNRANNRVTNLEYVTHRQNAEHAVRLRLIPAGEDSASALLTAEQVRAIRELLPKFTNMALGRIFKVNRETIRAIRTGRSWARADN